MSRTDTEVRVLRDLVVDLGRRADRPVLVASILGVNVAWLVILAAFAAAFLRVAGVPLLDLQNSLAPGEMITPTRALAQIAAYPEAARTLYWSFFILDGVVPPLVFGSLALLWVNLLHGRPGLLPRLLTGTRAVLIPLGVGLFDWIENLAYLAAINLDGGVTTAAIWIGLVAKWVKAAFLQVTMLTTVVVIVYVTVLRVRGAPAAATSRQPVRAGPRTPGRP